MKKIRLCRDGLLLILLAAITALNYKIFVFPNCFAPAGVDGVCTMIRHLLGTSMGYFSLLVNIPLLIFGALLLDRSFIRRTVLYTLSFSAFSVLLDSIDMTRFLYVTDTGSSTVLAPIVAGTVRGLLYVATLRLNGSAGGIDIIAAIVKRYRPHYHFMNIIFALNVAIAFSSYFVYGFRPEPVICSILYAFVTSKVSNSIRAKTKESVRFEVITPDADRLCDEISATLGLPSTVIEATGGSSGRKQRIVICVTNPETVPSLEEIVKHYDRAVSFESPITAAERIKRYTP